MINAPAKIWPLSFAHLVTDIYMPVIPAVLPLLIADRGLTFFLYGLEGLLFLIIPAVIMAVILRKIIPREVMQTPVADPGTDRPRVSFSPLASLFAASTLRAWAVFTAIAFFPALLITRGFDLFTANLMITLMLFAGVAGQIGGGIIADAYGKKEFTIIGLLCSVPFLFLFLRSTGIVSYIALILFGFFLWSSFAVTVAMSHEIMPSRVGMASGLMLGVAIGAGGIGVAINGMIADVYSLTTALYTITVLIAGAAVLMLFVGYPWNILERARH